jgi:hypothetical protein
VSRREFIQQGIEGLPESLDGAFAGGAPLGFQFGKDLFNGIDTLLSGHNAAFFADKDQVLAVGLEVSTFITVDDSGARHPGRNGYVTQIGNDVFAWFSSTERKSRINFLQLLQAGGTVYCCNDEALAS